MFLELIIFLIYEKNEKENLDEYHLKAKYDSWIENDWKDGNDNKIKNWKTKLKNTLPFIKEKSSAKKESNVSKSENLVNTYQTILNEIKNESNEQPIQIQ